MRITIHQPNFVPRLKVLQKLANADLWVILDSVQYVKQEWQNRTRIIPESSSLSEYWMTVPVGLPAGSNTAINDVSIAGGVGLKIRFRQMFLQSFKQTPFRQDVLDYWDAIGPELFENALSDLAVGTMTAALARYGKVPKLQWSSKIGTVGTKSNLVANLCKSVGATEYIADSGALRYLSLSDFGGIRVIWQDWDQQACSNGYSNWRDTGFVNILARRGPEWLTEHLANIQFCDLSNKLHSP